MGDAGSLMLGFLLAALSLGTSYSRVNNLGVFAPILILGVPIYDTILVTILRLKKGMSPFLGSKDHFALRLEKFGFQRPEILGIVYVSATLMTVIAYEVTLFALYQCGVSLCADIIRDHQRGLVAGAYRYRKLMDLL